MNIAVACGGTGGHTFPGLATARALMDRGCNVSLWLAGKDVENDSVKGWKGRVVTVPAEGFQFGAFRSFLTALRILRAVAICWWKMRRHRPDVVLAMGSYASIGPCFAARLRGIPYVLHEANAVPGKAVRLLAGGAAAVGICFEEIRYHLKGINLVLTGMPLRPELKQNAGVSAPEMFSLLVMGGSGGAHALNETVPAAVCGLPARGRIHVVHLAGSKDEETVSERYRAAGVSADVFAFTHDMASLYRNAAFAICRSGASSCTELCLFGVPSLLIPYPHAAGDHQTANARALEKCGAADLIQQSDLTVDWLQDYLSAQLENSERLGKMRARAAACGDLCRTTDAAENLAELVEQCARK